VKAYTPDGEIEIPEELTWTPGQKQHRTQWAGMSMAQRISFLGKIAGLE